MRILSLLTLSAGVIGVIVMVIGAYKLGAATVRSERQKAWGMIAAGVCVILLVDGTAFHFDARYRAATKPLTVDPASNGSFDPDPTDTIKHNLLLSK